MKKKERKYDLIYLMLIGKVFVKEDKNWTQLTLAWRLYLSSLNPRVSMSRNHNSKLKNFK